MRVSLKRRMDEARQVVISAKRSGQKVGLVPTMGALHQGHLSLAHAAKSECDFTVATIFVNPTQFGPGEDFEKYPRDLDRDISNLEEAGIDMVFAPEADEIYPPGHSTYVQPPKVAAPLEGQFRPEHFRGVCTIVLKLFQIIPANVSYFGQKDYQQTRVIEDMVRDLDIPIAVRVCATVREVDGLALSSRNAYLSDSQREIALSLSRALRIAADMLRRGIRDPFQVQLSMRNHLLEAGVDNVDYVALVDSSTLQPVDEVGQGTIALIAAYVGSTRLIDNAQLG